MAEAEARAWGRREAAPTVFVAPLVVSKRTNETIVERLVPVREHFGAWTLRDLEFSGACWMAS